MSALRQLFGPIFAVPRGSAGANTLTLDGPIGNQCSLSSGVEQFFYVFDGSALYTAADSAPAPALATMLVFDSFGAFVFNFTAPTIPGSITLVSGDGTAVLTISGTEADVFDFLAGAMAGALVTSPVPFPQVATQAYPVQVTISNAHGSASATTDYTAIKSADATFVIAPSGTLDMGAMIDGLAAPITPTIFQVTVTNGNADAQVVVTLRTDNSDSNVTFDYTPGTETGVVVTGQGTTLFSLTGVYDQIRNIFDGSSGAIVTATAIAPNGSGSFGLALDLNVINQPCPIAISSTGLGVTYTSTDFEANAVHFDGTTTVKNSAALNIGALTGLLSIWYKPSSNWAGQAVGSQASALLSTGAGADATNIFAIGNFTGLPNHAFQLGMSTSAATLNATTPANSVPDDAWHNILMTWDTNHASGARVVVAYVDDAPVVVTLSADAGPAFAVVFADPMFLGTYLGGGFFYEGDLSEFWINTNFLPDITDVAVRRKFISALGKPVPLGTDGSVPFGSAPEFFFGGVAAGYTNTGTAGAFSVTAGALTNASTSPSD